MFQFSRLSLIYIISVNSFKDYSIRESSIKLINQIEAFHFLNALHRF